MSIAAGDPILVETTPGYLVASSQETTDSSTFTTANTEIGSVTASLVDGVTYLVVCEAQVSSTVADDRVVCFLAEDNIAGTQIDRGIVQVGSETDRPYVVPLKALYTAGATGSKTFAIAGVRQSGTGNIRREAGTTHPQIITVTVT